MSVDKVTITVTGKNMTFRIRVFCILLILSKAGGAVDLKPQWSSVYQSSIFEFPGSGPTYNTVTAGRHPWLVGYFLNELVSWDPQDTLAPLTPTCSPQDLQKSLTESVTAEAYNEVFQKYSAKCEKEFVQAYRPPFLGLLGLFAMKYSLDNNPFLRRTVIHLPNGQKLKAVLALKDEKKRPFVIVRMGITGNVEEAYAERFFYYHLFERGFFHLLLVENLTSTDFIHNNQVMDFGGISEAYQNIWLVEKLRSPEEKLSKLIESVHLIGLSLGGQGVLASAWIEPVQKKKNLVQSFLGLCPLVNLQSTFNELFVKSYYKYPLEFWSRSRFAEIEKFRPDLYEMNWGLAGRLLHASETAFKKQAGLFSIEEPSFIKNSDDFYFLHNLSQWDPTLRKELRSWVTTHDSIVPVVFNSGHLPGLKPLVIEQGHHCSFAVEWHPHVTQALFNSHILQNSKMKFDEIKVVIEKVENSDYQFQDFISSKDGDLKLILKSQTKGATQEIAVTRDQLDFKLSTGPVNSTVISALKKWFSTNLKIHTEKEKSQMTVSWPFVKN